MPAPPVRDMRPPPAVRPEVRQERGHRDDRQNPRERQNNQ